MTQFPIKFIYEGAEYTASVYKISGGPIQYHVTDLKFAETHLPSPFIVSVDYSKPKTLLYPVDPIHYPCNFGGEIANAILLECENRGISPFN